MADQTYAKILKEGATAWNAWRNQHPSDEFLDLEGANLVGFDLSGADLSRTSLRKAKLRRANLSGANLNGARLGEADLRGANLFGAFLLETYLGGANLNGADLSRSYLSLAYLAKARLERANLIWADFNGADLTQATLRGANLRNVRFNGAKLFMADLEGADLRYATLVYTDLTDANLNYCRVHGVSVWNVELKRTKQANLIVTPDGEPNLCIGDLEIAQFVYLILQNEKLRSVIDTMAKQAVLLLGRFGDRKHILDALQSELRRRGYIPMLFDFERPTERDLTETVRILAGLSLFVIIDITNPRSSPLESQAIIPDYMIPFVPIIQAGEEPFAMFKDIHTKYAKWVLPPLVYDSLKGLLAVLDKAVVEPALALHDRLRIAKAAALPLRYVADYT